MNGAENGGGGKVRGDPVLVGRDNASGGFDKLAGAKRELPLPDLTNQEPDEAFVDTQALCLGALDDMERKVLRGQLQGYTHEEIAKQVGCVTRTVERKLKVIRSRWRA